MTDDDEPRWASCATAADYIGVSEKTIRNYIAQGLITGNRFGPKLLRVDLNEIDELMKPVRTA